MSILQRDWRPSDTTQGAWYRVNHAGYAPLWVYHRVDGKYYVNCTSGTHEDTAMDIGPFDTFEAAAGGCHTGRTSMIPGWFETKKTLAGWKRWCHKNENANHARITLREDGYWAYMPMSIAADDITSASPSVRGPFADFESAVAVITLENWL